MQITALDHLVLTVRNIEKTCAFYQSVLGMEAITYAGNRRALKFGLYKFNLHQLGREFEPRAVAPIPGSIDLCLLSATPMEAIIRHLQDQDIPIIEGPVQRTGANGPILSVYIRDPDQNLIEISNEIQTPNPE